MGGHYTLTLHKTGINAFARSAELAAITVKILDAGCQMQVLQDFSNSEIEKHPVSRGQHPVSANAGKGFHRNDLDEKRDFMQLEGKHKQVKHRYSKKKRDKNILYK